MPRHPNQESSERFSDKEAEQRFLAALRGSRTSGHKQMKEIPKKRKRESGEPNSRRRKSGQ